MKLTSIQNNVICHIVFSCHSFSNYLLWIKHAQCLVLISVNLQGPFIPCLFLKWPTWIIYYFVYNSVFTLCYTQGYFAMWIILCCFTEIIIFICKHVCSGFEHKIIFAVLFNKLTLHCVKCVVLVANFLLIQFSHLD